MIGFFPTISTDELLYSSFAKYQDRVQYPRKSGAIEDLLGDRTLKAAVECPSHLGYFVAHLPPGHHYTVDRLIDNHTLLPYFAPFLPTERVKRIRQAMEGMSGRTIHFLLGTAASGVIGPQTFRYCPLCVQEDREKEGGAYWHRVHQLTGVEVCPIHSVFLEATDLRIRGARNSIEFVSAERTVRIVTPRRLEAGNISHEILGRIARDAAWLLAHPVPPMDIDILHRCYKELLAKIGLVARGNRVRSAELYDWFTKYYRPELLALLGCGLNPNRRSWLCRMVHDPREAFHPTYHLLLIQFLGFTIEELLEAMKDQKDDDVHGHEMGVKARSRPKQPSTRECNSQDLSGPHILAEPFSEHINPNEEPNLKTIRGPGSRPWAALGPQADQTLRELWADPTISLRRIAKHFGVFPYTIVKHSSRLGLSRPRPQIDVATQRDEMRTDSRQTWLLLQEQNPAAGISFLIKINSRVYSWLYYHDRDWLKDNWPKRAERKKSHVDWAARDRELVIAIRSVVDRMKDEPGPPVRITRTSIEDNLNKRVFLNTRLPKLPQTAQVLAELTETREAFALRRIRWATEHFRSAGICPGRTRFNLLAATLKAQAQIPGLRSEIDAALRSLADLNSG